MEILRKRFKPLIWLSIFSGHLQTMFCILYHKKYDISYEREVLPVNGADGHYHGKLTLDWEQSRKYEKDTPTVIVIPGLTGTSESNYIQRFVENMSKSGYRIVVFNQRGNFMDLETPQLYNGAYTHDVRQAIQSVCDRVPEAHVFAVAFSLGANIFVKYLGEEKSKTPLTAAVAISNPWDLVHSSRKIECSVLGRWYSKKLGESLCNLSSRFGHIFRPESKNDFDFDTCLTEASSVRTFDELGTRRLFGYRSVDEYYRDGSSSRFLLDVEIPLLALHAEDDPICTIEAVSSHDFTMNENTILVTTKAGGHSMDWFDGVLTPKSWSFRVSKQFFDAIRCKVVPKQDSETVNGVA